MKPVLRLLLLLAALAYGAMPLQGVAAVALSVADAGLMAAASAHPHAMMPGSAHEPCPHAKIPMDTDHAGHMAMAGGHCGACLTLATVNPFIDAGPPVRTAEASGPAPRLKSTPAAPLERPPRLRG
tara:strand:+ start:3326 stop:3703 length:378 start_codon:yes stop_codon:yes gene_type:complete